jgi:hypothetical protein
VYRYLAFRWNESGLVICPDCLISRGWKELGDGGPHEVTIGLNAQLLLLALFKKNIKLLKDMNDSVDKLSGG